MKINKILKTLMDENNISTMDLSRKTNVPQSVIHRLMTGETENPTVATACALADYFGITITRLIGKPSANNKNDIFFEAPLFSWQEAEHWLEHTKNRETYEQVLTDLTPNKNLYALKIIDDSMSPIFVKGAILIVDGKRPPKNRSYIVIKPSNCKIVLLKQLLINNNVKYLKSLSQDPNDIQLFSKKDLYCGAVVQSKQNYENL